MPRRPGPAPRAGSVGRPGCGAASPPSGPRPRWPRCLSSGGRRARPRWPPGGRAGRGSAPAATRSPP
ncbi:MAG: hypothetical protein GEV09_02225 [Pseudonocardiaceae bacterium]|nr:hypothetical protein [Pseudonocardiaceae bacterium]